MTSGGISGSSPISTRRSRPSWWRNPIARCSRFWTAIQEGLLPALAKGDSAAAAKSYAEITARYTAHRAIIDDIVKQTNDQNAATEVAATGRVSTFTLMLWGVSAAVFLVIGAGIFGVAFGVIRPDRGNDGRDEGPRRRRPRCLGPGAQPRR